jgi:DNA ligase-1
VKAFAALFDDLDSTASTLEKTAALKKYFAHQDAGNSMWTIRLLTGRISKRVLTGRDLRNLFILATGYPEWLIEECHSQVGDTAETLSLLAQSLGLTAHTPAEQLGESLSHWMEIKIPELAAIHDQQKQAEVLLAWWKALLPNEVFIVNKLITGTFRVGVSEKLVVRALSELHEIPSDQIAHRLMGWTQPNVELFQALISKENSAPAPSQPYPFHLAHAWAERTESGWSPEDWCVEWKFDGIRAQVIARDGKLWIWSRGEEEVSAAFPDVLGLFADLPQGTVLDGELVVICDGEVRSFNDLQTRLGRKKVSAAVLKDKPAGFIAYDCLEFKAEDVRSKPLRERKAILHGVLSPFLGPSLKLSEILNVETQEELEDLRSKARPHNAEGLMIKSWTSPYSVGRKTGSWWKHKVEPLTLDAVLIYAQAGSGRRANLYTDYTFALWNNERELVTFAKAYSGLDQKEINELDRWIRYHTKEKFGPVRVVEAEQVFEIGFENIARSKRHKSGVAVRFPRILRWRKDKKTSDADTLETAESLLLKGL